MGMSLKVAKVHKIEYSSEKVHGYYECEEFIERLDNYASVLEEDGTHENGYGEGWMEHEIQRSVLEEIIKQDDEWFAENGKISDREIIDALIKESDQEEDYVYIYCFLKKIEARNILDNRVKVDLITYIKGVVDLKHKKDKLQLGFESYQIGLLKFDFDGECLFKEDGQYFYADASAEVFNLENITTEDLLTLSRDVYFKNF